MTTARPDKAAQFLQNLQEFNRKERFFLIGAALGKPDFRLDYSFRDQLEKSFGLTVPEDAFVAMDYHMDWIYASAYLAYEAAHEGPFGHEGEVRGNQQDIDLIVAFQQEETCHLILIEAKGVLPFSNAQLKHKAGRLQAIFGSEGRRFSGLTPQFAIASPKEPQRLKPVDWPSWMYRDAEAGTVHWIHIPLPSVSLKRVERCDQNHTPNANDTYWHVVR